MQGTHQQVVGLVFYDPFVLLHAGKISSNIR
jgi:hypothetical protein